MSDNLTAQPHPDRTDNLPEGFSWFDLAKVFWYFLEENRWPCLFWITVISIAFFYFLIPPLILGKTVDYLTGYTDGDSLALLYWYIAGLTVSWGVVSVLRLLSKRYLGTFEIFIDYNARVKGFGRLMENSLMWHDQENTGNKVTRIQEGAAALVAASKLLYNQVLSVAVKFVGVVMTFLVLDRDLGLLCFAHLGIFFAVQTTFYRQLLLQQDRLNQLRESSSGFYFEGASNVVTVKSIGAAASVQNTVTNREQAVQQQQLLVRDLSMWMWIAFQFVNAVSMGIFLYLVSSKVLAGIMTVGVLIPYFTYFNDLITAAQQSTNMVEMLVKDKTTVARMMPIFEEQGTIVRGQDDFPKEWQKLVCDRVTFAYPNREHSFGLEQISLTIPRNSRVGIVGASGSGKSTLSQLLLGLYPTDGGEIGFDDVGLNSINHDRLTQYLSVVPQESELFNMTLRENLTLMGQVSPGLLEKAIAIAQLEEVIARLPQGMDTLIGEKGYRLSGGERQRLAIARALCREPQILILDEATSSLDSQTEQKIQAKLDAELPDTTMIMIAHRVSTLQNVDRIYVMERGRIIEEGTYQGLLNDRNSKFWSLYFQNQENAEALSSA